MGGLLSGASTVKANFAGTGTIIEVTINAPKSGTAWDVCGQQLCGLVQYEYI
jgi:hypothetical protein